MVDVVGGCARGAVSVSDWEVLLSSAAGELS